MQAHRAFGYNFLVTGATKTCLLMLETHLGSLSHRMFEGTYYKCVTQPKLTDAITADEVYLGYLFSVKVFFFVYGFSHGFAHLSPTISWNNGNKI